MKNKKGFTLIELLVVISIIGILALMGLRVYGDQQKKAKNAIVIANASTVHNLIQGDLLDHDYSTSEDDDDTSTSVIENVGGDADPATDLANMKNPYNASGNIAVVGTIGTGNVGEVIIDWVSSNTFKIQGIGDGGIATGEVLIAIR
jgi:prepilin-type N-terminal cleavage/methylation domain-containing protein